MTSESDRTYVAYFDTGDRIFPGGFDKHIELARATQDPDKPRIEEVILYRTPDDFRVSSGGVGWRIGRVVEVRLAPGVTSDIFLESDQASKLGKDASRLGIVPPRIFSPEGIPDGSTTEKVYNLR